LSHVAHALVIIDMQVEYFEDEELAECRPKLVEGCNAAVRLARASGAPVFEVRTIHQADRSTWSLNMLEDDSGMVIEGSGGDLPLPDLDTSEAIVIAKTRDSAFYETRLEAMLMKRGVGAIALCGISTESCIAMTAGDAYARDLQVILVEEALASVEPASHDHTLARLADQYRQPTASVEELRFVRPERGARARPA
jgi:nicotinamidase-related amidase